MQSCSPLQPPCFTKKIVQGCQKILGILAALFGSSLVSYQFLRRMLVFYLKVSFVNQQSTLNRNLSPARRPSHESRSPKSHLPTPQFLFPVLFQKNNKTNNGWKNLYQQLTTIQHIRYHEGLTHRIGSATIHDVWIFIP